MHRAHTEFDEQVKHPERAEEQVTQLVGEER